MLRGFLLAGLLLCGLAFCQHKPKKESIAVKIIDSTVVVQFQPAQDTADAKKKSNVHKDIGVFLWETNADSLLPFLNVYYQPRRVFTDSNAWNILLKHIPGYVYLCRGGMYGGGWTIAWKSAFQSPKTIPGNWFQDEQRLPFEKNIPYFTNLLGKQDFWLKGYRYRLIAFNTRYDEMGSGHFIGGILGYIVLKKTDSAWVREYYNPAVGAYGDWQTADMPDLHTLNDSLLLLVNPSGGCASMGGSCSLDEEFLEYTPGSLKKIAWVRNLHFYKQRAGSNWGTDVKYADSIQKILFTAKGFFCPACPDSYQEVSEPPFGPIAPWWVYNHYGKKPFEFVWKRELQRINGHWKLTDLGCNAIRWLDEKKACSEGYFYK